MTYIFRISIKNVSPLPGMAASHPLQRKPLRTIMKTKRKSPTSSWMGILFLISILSWALCPPPLHARDRGRPAIHPNSLDSRVSELLAQARTFEARGDYAKALERYDRIWIMRPEDLIPYTDICDECGQQTRFSLCPECGTEMVYEKYQKTSKRTRSTKEVTRNFWRGRCLNEKCGKELSPAEFGKMQRKMTCINPKCRTPKSHSKVAYAGNNFEYIIFAREYRKAMRKKE